MDIPTQMLSIIASFTILLQRRQALTHPPSPQAHRYPHTHTEVQHAITHTNTDSPLSRPMPFDPTALPCPPSGLSSPLSHTHRPAGPIPTRPPPQPEGSIVSTPSPVPPIPTSSSLPSLPAPRNSHQHGSRAASLSPPPSSLSLPPSLPLAPSFTAVAPHPPPSLAYRRRLRLHWPHSGCGGIAAPSSAATLAALAAPAAGWSQAMVRVCVCRAGQGRAPV